MSEYRENFKKWFEDILNDLISNKADTAGAILLIVSFPLLERYLSAVVGKAEKRRQEKLVEIFSPQLADADAARRFWHIYRDGLLHQVTLNRSGDAWRVDEHAEAVEQDDKGLFLVNPVKFAQRVLEIINHDFERFASSDSLPKRPHLSEQGTNTTVARSIPPQYQDRFK
jgi:hypothetical protein